MEKRRSGQKCGFGLRKENRGVFEKTTGKVGGGGWERVDSIGRGPVGPRPPKKHSSGISALPISKKKKKKKGGAAVKHLVVAGTEPPGGGTGTALKGWTA